MRSLILASLGLLVSAAAAGAQSEVQVGPPSSVSNVGAPTHGAARAVEPMRLIFSELRTSGPAGPNDEFIELYNPTNTPFDQAALPADVFVAVSYADATGAQSAGLNYFLHDRIPTVPPHGHVRFYYAANGRPAFFGSWDPFVGAQRDYSAVAFSDSALELGLFNLTTNTFLRYDGVGTGTDVAGGDFAETAPVPYDTRSPAPANGQNTLVRKLDASGAPIDTDNNANDFLYLNGSGVGASGVGAPSPQSVGSLVSHDSDVTVSLFDPSAAASASPNQLQVGSGFNSTLFVRRTFTNGSGAAFTTGVGVRYTKITVTGFRQPGEANLRPVSAAQNGAATDTTVGGSTVANTGQGVNSEAYWAGSLANGASKNLNFAFTVKQPGHFSFDAVVEAK